jgi:glutamyl-tRNA synthetase
MKLPAASCGVSKRNSPKPTHLSILRSSLLRRTGALRASAGRRAIHPCSKLQGILAKANKAKQARLTTQETTMDKSTEENVIVRFPPSPTGYLHIGGARTAIFNWLFAKKTGGKFILRIEDTDAERSTSESIQGIIESLKWLGITWDEGPYFQSQFIHEHLATAQKLLATGHAYKCFCTKETLDRKRQDAIERKTTFIYDGTCRDLSPESISQKESSGMPYTIRLKVPRKSGAVVFDDVVYGSIEKKYRDLEDFVIVRSNGKPLYILSNAVDDIRDGVTHMIRGQDGLANTPKQILIYEALDAPIPTFAHMSLTLDPQKRKISKRTHGESVAVHFYREKGFLPWAMVNFLVHLGWSTQDSQEIFSQDELIRAFSLEGISRANSVFNIQINDPKFFTDPRAISINAHHLRNSPKEDIAPYVQIELEKAGLWKEEFEEDQRSWFLQAIDLLRSRYQLTTDFVTLGRSFFSNDFEIDPKALKKNLLKYNELKTLLPALSDRLKAADSFSANDIESVLRGFIEETGMKPGILTNGIRTAVTGQGVGPGLIEVLVILGRELVTTRLLRAAALFVPDNNA